MRHHRENEWLWSWLMVPGVWNHETQKFDYRARRRRYRKLKRMAIKNGDGNCLHRVQWQLVARLRREHRQQIIADSLAAVRAGTICRAHTHELGLPCIVQPLYRCGRKNADVRVLGFDTAFRTLDPPWWLKVKVGDKVRVPLERLHPTDRKPMSVDEVIENAFKRISEFSFCDDVQKEKYKDIWRDWKSRLDNQKDAR